MFLRRLIALENLTKMQPLIDEDQKLALLHAPFTGTTLFGREVAKLQEANTKRANSVTVFPPTAPPVSYFSRQYVGRGRSFKYSDQRGGYLGAVANVEDRASPRQMPLILNLKKSDYQCHRTPISRRGSRTIKPPRPLGEISVIFEGEVREIRSNEDVLPPQRMPVGGRLCEFVEGWKHITSDHYVLSIVTKGYRLLFTSPALLGETLWEIQSSQGPEEIQGMQEQISLMLKKNAITEVPPDSPGFYSNLFMVVE